jgi:hypothetical protein
MKRRLLVTIICLMPICAKVIPSLADYGKWVDENGVIHIVSDVKLVPERYLGQIEILQPSLDKITRPSTTEIPGARATSSPSGVTSTSAYPGANCVEPPKSPEEGVCLIIKWWLQDTFDDTEFRFLDVSPLGWLGDRWIQRVEFSSQDSSGTWTDKNWVFYIDGCGADAKVINTVEW